MKSMAEEKSTRDGRKRVRVQIADQCAPVLAGVKPSNIVILGEGDAADEIREILVSADICCDLFYEGDGKQMWLFYRKSLIEEVLREEENRDFLKKYGYTDFRLENVMRKVHMHFLDYKLGKQEFPHDIGVILGYPLADVKGFIENKGRNFLYSGYWKVYEDAPRAKERFDLYTMVRSRITSEIAAGMRFWQVAQMEEILFA